MLCLQNCNLGKPYLDFEAWMSPPHFSPIVPISPFIEDYRKIFLCISPHSFRFLPRPIPLSAQVQKFLLFSPYFSPFLPLSQSRKAVSPNLSSSLPFSPHSFQFLPKEIGRNFGPHNRAGLCPSPSSLPSYPFHDFGWASGHSV